MVSLVAGWRPRARRHRRCRRASRHQRRRDPCPRDRRADGEQGWRENPVCEVTTSDTAPPRRRRGGLLPVAALVVALAAVRLTSLVLAPKAQFPQPSPLPAPSGGRFAARGARIFDPPRDDDPM